MVSNARPELEQRHLSLLLVGGGGQVEVAQEPPELHGRGVALGQAGEVVVGAGQELPQLVGDGDCQGGHWKHGDITCQLVAQLLQLLQFITIVTTLLMGADISLLFVRQVRLWLLSTLN